ncbi:MAG: nitric oxide synthase oxygenase [Burkholderiales bacterium]|nr:nitric oxide synthase oxygenase [Burkholderiales bacterium]
MRRYYRETGAEAQGAPPLATRLADVRRDLQRQGWYDHTPDELAYGTRLAWRHHARCLGRLFWESLEVVGARTVTRPDEIAAGTFAHAAAALGDGRIRSMITVFAPVRGGVLPAYIESKQVVQYAGHPMPDGRVVGDRQHIEATRIARALGWQPPGEPGDFDVLPLVVREPGGRRLLYEVPPEARRELPIVHPTDPGIAALGLRWYAVPCVTGMVLTIGGMDYPCAPFNGFYMGTEIASRNLAEEHRYDWLADVARALGDDPGAPGPPLWKDRALLELNRAVLHSFGLAGVTIIDHHTASEQYMEFARREQAAGRVPSGDWSWLVPPQASPACPVFHLPMRDLHALPNFYHSRAVDGAALRPNHDDELRRPWQLRWERLRRRWWNWRRQRDGLRR